MKITNFNFATVNCTCGLSFQPDITDLKRERKGGYKIVGDTPIPESTDETFVVSCPLCHTVHEISTEIPQEMKKYLPLHTAAGLRCH